MNEIRHILKLAARRLEASALLGWLHVAAVVMSSAILVLLVADRLPALPFMPWSWAGPVLAAVGLFAALLLWARRRRTELQVATAVDERLDLREKLSTALHVHARDDAFAQAAVLDAVRAASDPRTRELVRRRFRVESPRGWWISPVILLAILGAMFLPQGLLAPAPDEEAEIIETKTVAGQTLDEVIKAIKDRPELSGELSDALGDLTREGTDPDALKTPEQIKRDAIKKITKINERLDEIINGEKSRTVETVEDSLHKLDVPKEGPARALAEALSRGDFKGAQDAMKQLQENLRNGAMNDEQKQQAAQQMQQMAQQLQQMAQQQQQLQEALRQAGLDPKLAQNPQALQQAVQQAQNLNEQQKQQLQQMAQAQQAANRMCQGLGQACQNMGQGLQQMQQQGQQGQQGQQQMGQGAQQMDQMLNDLEAMQQLLQEAQAAMNQCQGQAQAMGRSGQKDQEGGAMGGRGQGRGGRAPVSPTPTGTKLEQANIKTQQGDIIARTLVESKFQIVGESKKTVGQVVAELIEGYDEAILEDQLPRRYHEAQQHYFGELEKLTKAEAPAPGTAPGTAPGAAAAPDEPASRPESPD